MVCSQKCKAHRARFKKATKACKGKKINAFRSCMSKMLKK